MKTKGFTLVELLVVIAILAILATVSVVGYTSFIENAEKSAAETEAHQIETYVNAVLMADDACQIGTGVWAVRTADGIKLYTTENGTTAVAENTKVELITDLAGLENGDVYVISGKLVYVYDLGSDSAVGGTDKAADKTVAIDLK